VLVKLQCKVPQALNAIINRARIVHGSKEVALLTLVDLALADRTPVEDLEPFGRGEDVSCTLQMGNDEFIATTAYRLRHNLVTKTSFFSFALQHGARLYDEQNPMEAV
jgi:hypothetical protein